MQYWRIYNGEDNLIGAYTCDTCKWLHGKEHRKKAIVELRGNDKAEHAEGMILRLCARHFNELKEAGEIEA